MTQKEVAHEFEEIISRPGEGRGHRGGVKKVLVKSLVFLYHRT
jgi:hypothetical protein